MIYHVQQGGTSDEVYLHAHKDKAEADACRAECAACAYKMSEDLETTVEFNTQQLDILDTLLFRTAKLAIGR